MLMTRRAMGLILTVVALLTGCSGANPRGATVPEPHRIALETCGNLASEGDATLDDHLRFSIGDLDRANWYVVPLVREDAGLKYLVGECVLRLTESATGWKSIDHSWLKKSPDFLLVQVEQIPPEAINQCGDDTCHMGAAAAVLKAIMESDLHTLRGPMDASDTEAEQTVKTLRAWQDRAQSVEASEIRFNMRTSYGHREHYEVDVTGRTDGDSVYLGHISFTLAFIPTGAGVRLMVEQVSVQREADTALVPTGAKRITGSLPPAANAGTGSQSDRSNQTAGGQSSAEPQWNPDPHTPRAADEAVRQAFLALADSQFVVLERLIGHSEITVGQGDGFELLIAWRQNLTDFVDTRLVTYSNGQGLYWFAYATTINGDPYRISFITDKAAIQEVIVTPLR